MRLGERFNIGCAGDRWIYAECTRIRDRHTNISHLTCPQRQVIASAGTTFSSARGWLAGHCARALLAFEASADGAVWAADSNDDLVFVFKRTDNDAVTFHRLIDVFVDGASVPSWGYIVRAGSAIVTLTVKFLATLTPGIHTLTAVFADGNHPQVSFTVQAAADDTLSVSASAALVDGVAQSEQTPRTDDGATLPMGLLVFSVIASAAVAIKTRRCVQQDKRWRKEAAIRHLRPSDADLPLSQAMSERVREKRFS